jgi:hypothetical protein
MATQANCEANTNTHGELRWQYKLSPSASWRFLSDKHSRALTTAHGLGQSSFQLNLRRKEWIARWKISSVDEMTRAGGFARLESMVEVETPAALAPGPFLGHSTTTTAISAGAELQQRKLEKKRLEEEERGRRHAKAREEHAEDKKRWAQKLADEDVDTKSMRAAMVDGTSTRNEDSNDGKGHNVNGDKDQGPSDKRSRRVDSGALYTAGVAAYRLRGERSEQENFGQKRVKREKHKKNKMRSCLAQVLVRPRPLFAHEAERGEWDSITTGIDGESVVVHESAEKIVSGRGMVQMLRHHVFRTGVVVTDDDLYSSVKHLVQSAREGGRATLFCYGMTGMKFGFWTILLLFFGCLTLISYFYIGYFWLFFRRFGKDLLDGLTPFKNSS